MISRWFIGVNAKSKGYVTGFNSYYRSNSSKTKGVKPSFTKQTALAPSFDSEDDAREHLAEMKANSNESRKIYREKYILTKIYRDGWDKLSFEEKTKALSEQSKSVYYTPVNGQASYAYGRRNGQKWLSFHSINHKTWKPDCQGQIDAIENYDWAKECKELSSHVAHYRAEVRFVDEKLLVRECDIEFKFNLKERRPIKWEQRTMADTAFHYCNACGGAIPNIPQFVIGDRWSNKTRICAICMGRLAQEATIQAGKIPDEILDQYVADRFLME